MVSFDLSPIKCFVGKSHIDSVFSELNFSWWLCPFKRRCIEDIFRVKMTYSVAEVIKQLAIERCSSTFWKCSTGPKNTKQNQILILDDSECMIIAYMFDKCVITRVGNVDIPGYQDSPPTDCPPRGQY